MLSIIIAYYNQPTIDVWLQSLLLSNDKDFEVCIVNDGGDEFDILGIIRLYEDRIKIRYKYLGPRTISFRVGGAKNIGVDIATGDRIFITDPDCLIHKDAVGLHAVSEGICGGVRYHIPAGYVNSLTRRSLSRLDRISYKSDDRNTMMHRFMGDNLNIWELIWGCNFSMNRLDFWSVGGFSADYIGWGYEDLDMISRLVLSHVKVGFNFNAIVYHMDHGQVRNDTNRSKFISNLRLRGAKYIT